MNVKTSIAKTLLTMAIPFLTLNTAFAEDSDLPLPLTTPPGFIGPDSDLTPNLNNNVLQIGSVDSADQPGAYQNVHFYLTEQGKWELSNYHVGIELSETSFTDVELIITDTSPTQVFLKISGDTGCGSERFKQINHTLIGNTFNVFAYAELYLFAGFRPPSTCESSFTKIIPLSVYGLPEGEYSYNVNSGLFSGSFNLQNNTISPEGIQ
ncbi:hypothetical protein MNBD_GAMMA03-732 [hydrothermal vent metagenome]|uniref:Uncharacterized protein n=1 Tax=hydrothermal vent metagenome TaxID=652676 RepID=A0A3B0WEE9_9ZZZZ